MELVLTIAALFCFQSYGSINSSKADQLVLPGINHAPVFKKIVYTYAISEEKALGDSVGRAEAKDEDHDKLKYSLKSGNTNSAFTIDSLTGVILAAKHLDHHTQDSFRLVVQATDPGSLSGQTAVLIIVKPVTTLPDIASITWQTIISQPYGTHEVHGEVVNGKLYVFGGYDVLKRPKYIPTKRAFVYDPEAKTWAPIANLPHTPNGADFGGVTHEGLTTDGTDIFFAGGYPCNASGTAQAFGTKEVWRYNVSSNTYTPLPKLPFDLATGQLKYLKGRLHYIGGANKSRRDTSVHYALNLDSLTAGWKVLAPVINGTNHPGSAVYEGKIYFIGGAHKQDAASVKQNTVEVYDPNTNSWKLLASLPVGLDHISSSVIVVGSHILVVGGETAPNVKSRQVLSYSPATDEWTTSTPMPSDKSAGVAAFLNGAIYYTGGNFSNTNRKGTPVFKAATQLDSFMLVNAVTDKIIGRLRNGDTLNLATLVSRNINIIGYTRPDKVGSVKFNLLGPQTIEVTESRHPYTLFGDDGSGDFYAWTPPLGKYTLTATPYTGTGATGIAGTANTITFTVTDIAQQGFTLAPVADAFIRNGSYATTNYGIDTSLEVKSSPYSGLTRYSYLKFSLEQVNAFDSAKLRLYGFNTTNLAGVNISAFGVNDDSWSETGINFNNAPPALSTSLSTAVVTGIPKYYDFDVTSFVSAGFASDKTVTLVIKYLKNGDPLVVFNSRENARNQPQLVVTSKSQHSDAVFQGNSSAPAGAIADSHAPSNRPVIQNGSLLQQVRVYPNPVHNAINIEFANGYQGVYDLQIVNAAGKVYEVGKSNIKSADRTLEVDVSRLSLTAGIYFVRIHSETQQTQIIRFVVK